MRIIRRKEIKQKVGFTPHYCVLLEKKGQFPKRIRLGPNAVGWLESEVDAWLAERERVLEGVNADR